MSSKAENLPPQQSSDGLRRSKRIIRSEHNMVSSKVAKKTDEKPMKKSAGKIKSKRGRKPKNSQSVKKDEMPNSFSGSYLTRAELHELLLKYTRDGHFRVNPASESPPPLVISRTIDGKIITTKIECHDSNHQFVHDSASSIATQVTEAEVPKLGSKSMTVTFSRPVEESPSGSSSSTITNTEQFVTTIDKPTSSGHGQSISSSNNNSKSNSTSNCSQNTGTENEFVDNSWGFNLHPKTLSARGNVQGNPFLDISAGSATVNSEGNRFLDISSVPNLHRKSFPAKENSFVIPSGAFSIVNSAQQTLPARPNLYNSMFMGPPSNQWISSRKTTLRDINDSNIRGIYFPSENSQYNDTSRNNHTKRSNNSKDTHGIHLNLLNRYDYSNSDAARIHDTSSYQQRETNTENSTFPLQNQFNSNNEQYTTGQTNSNAFGVKSATITSNALNLLPANANCYIPPRNVAYNSKMESNNCPYVVAPNNFSMSQNDRYRNSYISMAAPTYYGMYNTINASGRCETATRPINGDQRGIESQMNFRGQMDSNITDFFETKDHSSPMALNNYPSNTMIDSNVTGTITDSVTGLSRWSNEETGDLTKIFEDSQNNGFCQTASFDNITYNNYTGESLVYNNENSEIRTERNDFPSELPSATTIQTDMGSWYDCSKQSAGAGNVICDFDTKKEFPDSSDCYIIE